MARKKITRRLPRLPKPPSIGSREDKTARLIELLRGVSIATQTEESRPFYPVREVASHFHVPLSTVARIYGKLEDEGLLVPVRGSQTVLQGRSSGRRLNVQGFVGIPAAVSAFVALQDYRNFCIRTRRELRARGFAVATVFFDPQDIKSGRLFARIDKYGVDTILWYQPDTSVRHVIGQLKDAGVSVVGINDGRVSALRCRYDIRREMAISTILSDWRSRSQITSAVILRGPRSAPSKEQILEALMEEQHLECVFEHVDDRSPKAFLESLRSKNHRGIIIPSWVASLFAFRAPQAMATLATECRVMFPGGPPNIPFADVADVPADLVTVDWQLLAEEVVADLISKKATERGETTIIKARPNVRASLRQYAESL